MADIAAKIIKVTLVDKDTLRLEEDAKAGDLIQLSTIANIDTSVLSKLIEDGKDALYNKKLEEALNKQKQIEQDNLNNKLKIQEQDFNNKINELNNTIKGFEDAKKLAVNEALAEQKNIESNLKVENANLKNQLDAIKTNFENEKKLAVKDANEATTKEIEALKQKITLATAEKENALLKQKNDIEDKFDKIIKDNKENSDKEIEKLQQENSQLQVELGTLKNTKARLNNKEIGEDLECYCNDQVNNLMQIGFDNCTWEKDNTSIKEDGETKGTKADFIYKVFTDSTHDGEPLCSVCLEMKNEKDESENKKKNSDHFSKLDKDRNKKQCKYAILVSNLENDNDNILPIYKVNNYQDMYVVRPAYLTTLITIITSLTMKFKDIILADKNEQLDLMSKQEFLNEFESLKNTYLDKPLEQLGKEVDLIRKSSNSIIEAANKINLTCDDITTKYINEIINKLDKFNNNINKSYKRLDKAN